MLLSDDLVERLWAQPVGERGIVRRSFGRAAGHFLIGKQVGHGG
jgi:hypothetical protein